MSLNNDYYEAYFDGATEPTNPNGNLGMGSVIFNKQGDKIFEYSKFISLKDMPKNSNNCAEYLALISVLEYFTTKCLTNEKIIICGDSKLVIEQMKGSWICNGGIYEPFYRTALKLRMNFTNVIFKWIPREQNYMADDLSKKELLENNIKITVRHDGRKVSKIY